VTRWFTRLTAKLNKRRIKRMTNSALSVSGLRVRRGGRLVVRDVSFEVPRGAVTGLLGPSGCGKTTLMRAIVGVQIVEAGEVALLGKPELLVLDEPTVGLDPVLRDELWALFRRLAGSGATLLVSSHVMDEAARCDRLLLMREGVLLADDSPAVLRERTGTADL